MRDPHTPRRNRPQSVAYEDLSWSNGCETHTLPYPMQVDQWLRPLSAVLVLGASLCKMMNKHKCTKCKNVYYKYSKYNGTTIVTNYKTKQMIDCRQMPTGVPTHLRPQLANWLRMG